MINICLEKLKHVQKFQHKDSLRLFVNIVHRFGDFYISAAYLVVISANLMITIIFQRCSKSSQDEYLSRQSSSTQYQSTHS